MSKPVIMWFRDDLRLSDHRALAAAADTGAPIVLLYILDDDHGGGWALGSASKWWLAHSLSALSDAIDKRGNRLVLRRGRATETLLEVIEETGASAVYVSRGYEPETVALEKSLKVMLEDMGVAFKRYGGRLLREPEDIRTKTGDIYKVYTPFWRALSADFSPPTPIAAPKKIRAVETLPKSDKLNAWKLLPTKPDWSKGFSSEWQPGEAGARKTLDRFLASALKTYTEDRNRPDKRGTSRLSPHLRFGEITPAECWRAAVAAAAQAPGSDKGLETFLKELVWREFSYTLLFHWPDLPEQPFKRDFAAFAWKDDAAHLKAWQRGMTGYPIVDAGMRELWTTGYMHNRVRMVVASFLIKHLLVSWQLGEAWFWDTLVDADLASNSASWQWVAGSGADAAPYFRIFNPVTQGEKFDPDGDYVRRWVPEIAKLPNDVLHAPWMAAEKVLADAGVTLGKTYPKPIVEHAAARQRALDAYDMIRKTTKGAA